ncbi:hypothetical protein GGR06_003394 [Bacteroides reticulotermitis]|uniref:Uncharacterized protein n=1 Tax=Bacteroides reticulotermitis TaxID=1133319 RepID=A0A840D430_9BACE|nr:hypothetical protein [Bacteroides reticulotermitis]
MPENYQIPPENCFLIVFPLKYDKIQPFKS